ncbi:MAG: hypothetical protein M3Y77_09965, partial [Actinomycetota bacterium]|nr:hypothetical protein [Actinomycetota bacterium]
ADSIGWPDYAREIGDVYLAAAAKDPTTVIIVSNYGEYGAVVQYGPANGLPHPYSGHNQLYSLGLPPAGAATAVIVGGQYNAVRGLFSSCTVRGQLDNNKDIDNEEQDLPIAVCTGPTASWDRLWPSFQHYG